MSKKEKKPTKPVFLNYIFHFKSDAQKQWRFKVQLCYECVDGGGIAGFGFPVVRKLHKLYPTPPQSNLLPPKPPEGSKYM